MGPDNTDATPTNMDLLGEFEFQNRMTRNVCYTSLFTYYCSNFEYQVLSMLLVFLFGITMLQYWSNVLKFPYNTIMTSMIIEVVVTMLSCCCCCWNSPDNTDTTPTN